MQRPKICLVNGAQGIVKKIWFDQGSNPCSHLPAVVFVEFSGYSGPETPEWEGISPSWVPLSKNENSSECMATVK
jgi:hypothetical protein